MFRFITILLFLAFSACGLLGEDKKGQPDELRPLAMGNWWEYEVTYSSIKDTLRYEVRKVETVSIEGETYTAFGWNLVPFPENTPEYYWLQRNGENGLYTMGGIADTDTLFVNELSKKYPAEVGETWRVPQLAFSRSNLEFYVSDTLEITLVDNDRQVDTPAGTFLCYVYKFSLFPADDVPTLWDYFMFYKPGTGLIMQKAVSQLSNETKEELVLINYDTK